MEESGSQEQFGAEALTEKVESNSAEETTNIASRRLEQLSSRLVQVDRRNPTIRLLKKPKERAFDVAACEQFRPGTMQKALNRILADKSALILSHADRPRGADDKPTDEGKTKRSREEFRAVQAWRKVTSHLTALRRKKHSNYEETGSQDFYLGFPWISGCCDDEENTFLQAPLLLFPVDLTIDRKKGVKWTLSPAQEQYPIFNSTLVQALARFDNSTLPQEFVDEAEAFADDKDLAKSPEKILEWFAVHLAKYGVNISHVHYPLSPLPEYKASTLPKRTRGFSLSSNVVFGCFPLSNSALKQDYEAMQEMAMKAPEELPTVLSQLLSAEATEEPLDGGEEGDFTMDTMPEAETCFVLPSDSSQEEVLLQARKERCLVVHGPPGTGKSQVIVNLISDALARNERVLVCCQKRAALDVVYQRLDKHGLSRHCAIVHDASADRKELYASISRAMDVENPPSGIDRDLDTDIQRLAKSIDEKSATLKAMAHELHRPRRSEMRARDLYSATSGEAPPKLEFGVLAAGLTKESFATFEQGIRNLASAHRRISADHPWQERTSFAALSKFDKDKVAESLNQPRNAAAGIAQAFSTLSLPALTPQGLSDNAKALDLIEAWGQAISIEGAEEIFAFLESGSPTSDELVRTMAVLQEHLPKLAKLPARPKEKLHDDPGQMAYQLENYREHYQKFFKFLNGAFRDAKKLVEPYLGVKGIAKDDAALNEAIDQLRSQQRWEAFDLDIKDLAFKTGLDQLSRSAQVSDLITAFGGGLEAYAAHQKLHLDHASFIGALLDGTSLEEIVTKLGALRKALASIEAWRSSIVALDEWVTPDGRAHLITKGLENADSAGEAIQALSTGLDDFDDLVTLDVELAKLSEQEMEVYRALLCSGEEPKDWPQAVKLGVYFAWLEECERESPLLREVSGPSFANTAHSFVHDIAARRELNQKRLQRDRFRAATEIRFEPGRVTDKRHSAEKAFNDLRHQVNKKSRLWSLRRLVSTCWWPLREIMPVWLVSPETLSAAFPLERNLFDLVIFDEASQCAVEHGVPATYRGKRVIIAGDEQQLQPSKQFQAKTEFLEEDEDLVGEDGEAIDSEAIETDSILRLARARFAQRMLTWHYRSKFEELIDFSNHGFYDGRLKTVPDTMAEVKLPPIEYIKVEDGEWRNRANRPEGERVVEEVFQLLLQHGAEKSVGVITFNTTQREMILNIIDERSNEDAEFAEVFTQARGRENLDDALFVKNIENVQGDERDIIIFSIGYGPAEDGRVRANFGSLSQAGGENRLNVAVSRAREAIKVIASIEPEDLNVANSTNRGPRLIRAYLDYARAVSRLSEEMRQSVLKEINPAKDAVQAEGVWFESPFEEQVFEALTKADLTVDTQVGVSGYRLDLAIVDPNMASKYVIGIECDGASYHSAPSVRERDAYRQAFLESRGWHIYRIWSRNWWNNPQREVENILKLVQEHQSPTPPKENETPSSAEPSTPTATDAIDGKPKGKPGPYQGEFPPEGEIQAWLEEQRDGFTYYAIADFGDGKRMDEYGWASTRIEARAACEKAQLGWLSDQSMPANLYVKPLGADEPETDVNDE